jgi:beta-lactamase superfamily II metal-dependent hydrolase
MDEERKTNFRALLNGQQDTSGLNKQQLVLSSYDKLQENRFPFSFYTFRFCIASCVLLRKKTITILTTLVQATCPSTSSLVNLHTGLTKAHIKTIHMAQEFIATDLVKVYKTKEKKPTNLLTVLGWGDVVEVLEKKPTFIRIGLKSYTERQDGSIVASNKEGFILFSGNKTITKPVSQKNVLQVSFVDVQQGDGCVIETPDGKVILVDGGENQMFARYLAARFSGTSPENPRVIDFILVTHGDADHFLGLPEILKSETNKDFKKRLFIRPLCVYHNGIIKGPSSRDGKPVADKDLLGKTTTQNGQLYLNDLQENLLEVPDKEMNLPFRTWKKTLKEYADFYGPITIKRLDHLAQSAFAGLNNITMEVLGPITKKIGGKPALKFLRTPPKSAAQSITDTDSGSYSASHTINGHSVILRMTYGNVRFFFAGDLNEEAEDLLVANAASGQQPVQSEVLKVPHHGSADFSDDFLQAVNPMISVVSSGDENEQKEYIHPRATLMGALGNHSRIPRSLVFVTEMVAFLKTEGWATLDDASKRKFFAFSRSAYGIVHVRTDGKRILVFTHTGKRDLKEAYAFTIDAIGAEPRREDVVII